MIQELHLRNFKCFAEQTLRFRPLTLLTGVNGMGKHLTTEYSVARWLNDPDVDREARRYFRSLATKAPYLQDVDDPQVQEKYKLSEFLHEKGEATGLGVAFLLEALAISFHSDTVWEQNRIQVLYRHIQEDSTLDEGMVIVRHACSREHVLEHSHWIEKRRQVNIERGADLYAQCEALYPHLRFCESALKQMQGFPSGVVYLRHIMKHLRDLNSYCEAWQSGPFSPETITLDISMESPTTLHKYSDERTFLCPDNMRRLFSWHSKDKFMNWRIQFYPLEQERVIIIGHIGRHLPTVKYPT